MASDISHLSGNWGFPTSIRFGAGRIKELAKVCKNAGMARPLIVTDPGLARLPMIADAKAALEEAGLGAAVFSDVKGNPVSANVEAGLEVLREGGHDGVVAFGGGSAMDAGKTIAFMAGQTRPMWDFEDVGDNWKRADADAILPVIAVPTTSGTGSEVGRAAVINNEEAGSKIIVFHPGMLAKTVICDPELVTGLPANLTAWTGMDALAHCFEALSSPVYHPMAEGIALEGMWLIERWLPTAVRDGKDVEARAHMMAAAAMGAVAFQKGLGAIHSLSHPVGARYDSHHGRTNAVFMPYVMMFNRSAIEEKVGRAARLMGLRQPTFDGFLKWVLDLREEFDVPHTCAELGVKEADLDQLAEMAEHDPSTGGNPIPAGKAEMRQMLDAAMAGKL